MSKHAPTPYKLRGKSISGNNHFKIIGTRYGTRLNICSVPFIVTDNLELNLKDEQEAEATAKFIVKACNSHDKLVEALDQVIEDINTGNYGFGEHMFDEWNQLLTELKS